MVKSLRVLAIEARVRALERGPPRRSWRARSLRFGGAPDARLAAWTVGVSDILTWLTTRGGGVLLEYAKDPWRVEGDPVELAREHLDRLRWLEDAKRR